MHHHCWAEGLNRHFSKAGRQVASRHTKRWSMSLLEKYKSNLRGITSHQSAWPSSKKSTHDKRWRGCGGKGTLSGGSDGEDPACSVGDWSLIPGSGRSPGGGHGYPLQYSCLENPMDRAAWWATVHGVKKSRTQLSHFPFHFTLLVGM